MVRLRGKYITTWQVKGWEHDAEIELRPVRKEDLKEGMTVLVKGFINHNGAVSYWDNAHDARNVVAIIPEDERIGQAGTENQKTQFVPHPPTEQKEVVPCHPNLPQRGLDWLICPKCGNWYKTVEKRTCMYFDSCGNRMKNDGCIGHIDCGCFYPIPKTEKPRIDWDNINQRISKSLQEIESCKKTIDSIVEDIFQIHLEGK